MRSSLLPVVQSVSPVWQAWKLQDDYAGERCGDVSAFLRVGTVFVPATGVQAFLLSGDGAALPKVTRAGLINRANQALVGCLLPANLVIMAWSPNISDNFVVAALGWFGNLFLESPATSAHMVCWFMGMVSLRTAWSREPRSA